MTYGGTYRYYTKIQARYGVEFTFVDTANPTRRSAAAFRPNTKMLHLESPTNPTMRLCDIAQLSAFAHEQRRDRRRGQHVLLAVPAAAARPRRRHRHALDDEVPERPLRLDRRHRRGEEAGARRVALVRPEQLGRDPLALRLLARPARDQDARRPDGAPRVERPRGRRLAREAEEDLQGQLPGPARPPAARARAEADEGIRGDDLLRPRLVREGRRVPREVEALLARREPRRRRDADLASGDDDPRRRSPRPSAIASASRRGSCASPSASRTSRT